jgi:hypothetical protein
MWIWFGRVALEWHVGVGSERASWYRILLFFILVDIQDGVVVTRYFMHKTLLLIVQQHPTLVQ